MPPRKTDIFVDSEEEKSNPVAMATKEDIFVESEEENDDKSDPVAFEPKPRTRSASSSSGFSRIKTGQEGYLSLVLSK